MSSGIVTKIKVSLRISNSAYDIEIEDLINAARQDLILSGVNPLKANSNDDALILRAINIYVKANFGYGNPEAEKLQQSYGSLKEHLTLSQEYTGGDTVVV